MLCLVNWENAHLLGDALPALHRLRHRVFVKRQGWNVPEYRGMEYDQFDTPAADYLVWFDNNRIPRGVTRLIPTTRPYMIKELWSAHLSTLPPSIDTIWEASRIGVDRDLPPDMRRRVLGELICGCLELGLKSGFKEYLCVMHPKIIQRLLISAGLNVDMDEPWDIDGEQVVIGKIEISRKALLSAKEKYGINKLVVEKLGSELEAA
ncbi:MAG: GNAT family N-acetyltransferase [Rhodospirillales bacterium]|nr:GNAT family N-acetyltransferase [Rhodospirillales bacterium]